MATVIRNALGSSGRFSSEGFQYAERVVVEAIPGADLGEAIHSALVDAAMPQRGDSRIFDPAGPNEVTVYCVDVALRSAALSGAQAKAVVEVSWSQTLPVTDSGTGATPDDDGAGVTTVGTVVETTETEFDFAGAEITVKRDASSPSIIQPVQYRRPRPVIEHSRWEVSNPRTRAETFVGKLNSGTWNGFADKTVLCTGITGTTRDRGDTFDVRYDFEVDPNGWDVTVVYIDEDTGRPISGLVDTVSKKTITLYTATSFAPLNITL